jgi:hypothetical protein
MDSQVEELRDRAIWLNEVKIGAEGATSGVIIDYKNTQIKISKN